MSSTAQCQNPDPVGASGSYNVKAKLLVPAGAPFHANSGEMFPPLQSIPFRIIVSGTVPPSFSPGIESEKSAAAADPMLKASSDSAINDFRIANPPERAAYPRGSKGI